MCGGTSLRLIEGATTVRGLGLRDFESAAAFVRLRRWLRRPDLRLPVDEGWSNEAPRHEAIEFTRDGELIDTSGGWDEWSARAVVIARLARNVAD